MKTPSQLKEGYIYVEGKRKRLMVREREREGGRDGEREESNGTEARGDSTLFLG